MTLTYRMLGFGTTHHSVEHMLIVHVGDSGLVYMRLDI